MEKSLRIVVCLIIVAVASTTTQAGILDPSVDPDAAPFLCDFANSANSHNWSYNYTDSLLTITELIAVVAPDDIVMSGETDSDPIFTVVKTVENNSGVDWTGYELVLSGSSNPTFVPDTAGAGGGKLGIVDYLDSQTIVFSGLNPVLNGETLSFQVDVQIPTEGLFDFTLSQQPIPEPATLSLLAVGSSLFFRRRFS